MVVSRQVQSELHEMFSNAFKSEKENLISIWTETLEEQLQKISLEFETKLQEITKELTS